MRCQTSFAVRLFFIEKHFNMGTENCGKKQPDRDSGPRTLLPGNLYIFIATVLFAINIPVAKVLIPQWLSADGVTVVRLGGGCLLFWIASIFIRRGAVERGDRLRIMFGGGISVFFFIYLLNLALKYGNPIDVSIIMTLPPMYLIVYQMIFRRVRPHWLEVAGMLVAFAGAVIVIVSGKESKHAPEPLPGDLIAVVCGVAYMIYLLILEKPTHKYHPIAMLKWVFLGAMMPCLFICGSVAEAPVFHTADVGFMPWFWIFFLAAGPSFLAYLLVNPAIKMIGSELVAIYQYFMPVVATIVAVILGEATLMWQEGVAMVIIIGGMLLTNIGHRRKIRETGPGHAASLDKL